MQLLAFSLIAASAVVLASPKRDAVEELLGIDRFRSTRARSITNMPSPVLSATAI